MIKYKGVYYVATENSAGDCTGCAFKEMPELCNAVRCNDINYLKVPKTVLKDEFFEGVDEIDDAEDTKAYAIKEQELAALKKQELEAIKEQELEALEEVEGDIEYESGEPYVIIGCDMYKWVRAGSHCAGCSFSQPDGTCIASDKIPKSTCVVSRKIITKVTSIDEILERLKPNSWFIHSSGVMLEKWDSEDGSKGTAEVRLGLPSYSDFRAKYRAQCPTEELEALMDDSELIAQFRAYEAGKMIPALGFNEKPIKTLAQLYSNLAVRSIFKD